MGKQYHSYGAIQCGFGGHMPDRSLPGYTGGTEDRRVHPFIDPNEKPPTTSPDPAGRDSAEPDFRYVTASEARPEDRVTFLDYLAAYSAVGCAQFLRLLIIIAAIALLFGIVYLITHGL